MILGIQAKDMRSEVIRSINHSLIVSLNCEFECFHVRRYNNQLANTQANLMIHLVKKECLLYTDHCVSHPIM